MSTVKAKDYVQQTTALVRGELKFKAPEKTPSRPGKPAGFQIIVEDTAPSTFQLWNPADGAQYPVMPFGVSEPLNNDRRKKTLEMAIRSEKQREFIRMIDRINLQHLSSLSMTLWNVQLSAAEILEKKYYMLSLRGDPNANEGKRGKSGEFYDPSLRTHFYVGDRDKNAEGKEVGAPSGVIIPARPPHANYVPVYTDVSPFDHCVPVVRFAGMWFTQGKWAATFITESFIHIKNQRQAKAVPNVDLASLPMADYVEPDSMDVSGACAGGGGGMIFGEDEGSSGGGAEDDNIPMPPPDSEM